MEGRIIECHRPGGGLDYHNSPLIGEIPTNDYSHYHRSIDQLRSIGMVNTGGTSIQHNNLGGIAYHSHLHHPPFSEQLSELRAQEYNNNNKSSSYPATLNNNNNNLERIDYNNKALNSTRSHDTDLCDMMNGERTSHINNSSSSSNNNNNANSISSNNNLETEANLKNYHKKDQKLFNNHQHHHHSHHNGIRSTTPSPLTAPTQSQLTSSSSSSSILSPPPSLSQPPTTPPIPAYTSSNTHHHSSSSSSAHTITTRSSVDGHTKEAKVGYSLYQMDLVFCTEVFTNFIIMTRMCIFFFFVFFNPFGGLFYSHLFTLILSNGGNKKKLNCFNGYNII
jgi:hypothetical protein